MLLFILLTLFAVPALAQNEDGPPLPVVLEHADSVLGSGPTQSGIREFFGSVRFSQGNVTVTCDRAVHNLGQNRVDLYGHVVVKQDGATISASELSYDGNTYIATAPRGLKVLQGSRTITSKRGLYSTRSRVARFFDDVTAVDDSARIWADTLLFDRKADTTEARGNVVVSDSVGYTWFAGDRGFRDTGAGLLRITSNARLWQWDSTTVSDTLYLQADTLISRMAQGARRFNAYGNAQLVRGAVAARSDTMNFSNELERFVLLGGQPILWSDSLLLIADTLVADAPGRKLRTVTGFSHAILVSRSDTAYPDRFDQISGNLITLEIANDTVRSLTSTGAAQSITFRTENSKPEGLAKAASDTIRAIFSAGELSDVYWLGGIEGEHHPEPVVAGRASTYRLPGFIWREDRPIQKTRINR